MAAQPIGAPFAVPSDPIQLHAHAINSLSRCMHELRSDGPSYTLAQDHLEEAREALQSLLALEAGSVH